MAVIYMPEDKRWQTIGQGIGQMASLFAFSKLKAADDERADQVISDVMANQSIKPEDKALEIQRQGGSKALTRALQAQKWRTETLTQQKDIQQTATSQAEETYRRGLTAGLPDVQRKQAADASKAEADLLREPLQTEKERADIEKSKQETQTSAAQEGLAKERTTEATGSVAKQRFDMGALVQHFREGDALVKQEKAPEGWTQPEWDNLRTMYSVGGPAALEKGITAHQAAITKTAEIPAEAEARAKATQAAQKGTEPLEASVAEPIARSAAYIGGLEQVTKDMIANPKATGGISAGIGAWLTEHGYTSGGGIFKTGDLTFDAQLANTHQLVADAAASQKGFTSAQSIGLAKQISPSVLRGKGYGIAEANALADRTIDHYQSLLKNYQGTKKKTDQIEDIIASAKRVKELTGSLWSTAEINPFTNKPQAPVVYFQGKQVDEATLQPIRQGSEELPADRKIDLGNGHSTTGAELNAQAKRDRVTVEAELAVQRSYWSRGQ